MQVNKQILALQTQSQAIAVQLSNPVITVIPEPSPPKVPLMSEPTVEPKQTKEISKKRKPEAEAPEKKESKKEAAKTKKRAVTAKMPSRSSRYQTTPDSDEEEETKPRSGKSFQKLAKKLKKQESESEEEYSEPEKKPEKKLARKSAYQNQKPAPNSKKTKKQESESDEAEEEEEEEEAVVIEDNKEEAPKASQVVDLDTTLPEADNVNSNNNKAEVAKSPAKERDFYPFPRDVRIEGLN
jgi:ribonuclease E